MTGPRSSREEQVVTAVREGRDELVELVASLVACDTTARNAGDPARDEDRCQRLIKARLETAGAETDLWEPEAIAPGGRLIPQGLDFRGRPQLAAHVRGRGAGRSLLLNGHIDVVDVEPRADWTSDPLKAEVRDGRLYGRGTADMKGGVAAYLFALEVLRRLDVPLLGDLVWCSNTDEESSGVGGIAAVDHGVRADAGIVGEPTGFDAWVTCRGSLTPRITVEGRAGHAEMPQPHWREGGAVNAIEKAMLVLNEIKAIHESWQDRADQQHPILTPGIILPTIINGGTWDVTYPASCEITAEVMYLPSHVDAEGTGRVIEDEVRERIEAAVAVDPWFAEHPLKWLWDGDVVPAEISGDHPLVTLALDTGAELGRPGKIGGLDSWHDAATFTRSGTPTFSYGPGGDRIHGVDEYVPVDDLVESAAAVALVAMRWCGVAG